MQYHDDGGLSVNPRAQSPDQAAKPRVVSSFQRRQVAGVRGRPSSLLSRLVGLAHGSIFPRHAAACLGQGSTMGLSYALTRRYARRAAVVFALLLPCTALAAGALVYFDQPESAKIFTQAESKGNYWQLSRYYETQRIDTFCSVTSSTMVLNALGVKPAIQQAMIYPFNKFNHENFFTPAVLAMQPVRNIAGDGLTLAELGDVLATFGVRVEQHPATTTSAADFRRLAQAAVSSTDRYVIVNFLRSAIGQEGGGHFSPLAAYDAKTDRFLILDTARYKYAPFWVLSDDLWTAMNTVDKDSKTARGFLIVAQAPK
jgi:hypothetical protein